MTLVWDWVRPGQLLHLPFDTFSGTSGASITIAPGTFTTADIKVYRDGDPAGPRTGTAGYALLGTGIDFDGLVGIHGYSIDLSSNTPANFYRAGQLYWVVIDPITVDTQTVRFVHAIFRIGYEQAMLNTYVNTLTSQTVFTLQEGPLEAQAYRGCPILLHQVAGTRQMSYSYIDNYAATTREVTLRSAPTFTLGANDNASVFMPMDTLALPIPPAPVADSVYERLRTMDDNLTSDIYAALTAMRAGMLLTTIRSGTTPTAGSFQLPDGSFTLDDQLNGAWCILLTEPPIARKITDSILSTQTVTFAGVGASVADRAFPSAPAANTPLAITGLHGT
jgi:hypothetical protein